MTEAQLSYYASWTSIISLFMSAFSLLYLRNIKHNIVKFRRKQRLRELLEDVLISSEGTVAAELTCPFVVKIYSARTCACDPGADR